MILLKSRNRVVKQLPNLSHSKPYEKKIVGNPIGCAH